MSVTLCDRFTSSFKGAAHNAPGVSADQHWSGTATFLAPDTVLGCSIRRPPFVGTDITSLPHTEFASMLFFPEAAGFLTSFSSSMAKCLRSLCICNLAAHNLLTACGEAHLEPQLSGRLGVEELGFRRQLGSRRSSSTGLDSKTNLKEQKKGNNMKQNAICRILATGFESS